MKRLTQGRRIVYLAYEKLNITVAIVLVHLVYFSSTSAFAFAENGFLSGMSVDAVAKVVQGRGSRLQADSHDASAHISTYVAVSEAPGSTQATETFSFCNGRLNFYSTLISGGLPAFTRLAERANADHGMGLFSAHTFETQQGPVYQVRIEWSQPQTQEWLMMAQSREQSIEVTHSFFDNAKPCK